MTEAFAHDFHSLPPAPVEAPWTLDVLGAPAFAVHVFGAPAPQGSKTSRPIYRGKKGEPRVFTGKVAMTESSKGVAPWRSAVAAVATAHHRHSDLLDGPLVADMVFTMPKGTTLAKWKDWHDVTPDLSKLARSTEDALTGRVWVDDARVVAYRRLEARYVGSWDNDTLPRPGAVIRVWQVPEALIAERKDAARRRLL